MGKGIEFIINFNVLYDFDKHLKAFINILREDVKYRVDHKNRRIYSP